MASTVDFNSIGFFNSIMPLNQTNWASYFGPYMPDGIIEGIGDEMDVYADSSGMHVFVKTGECRVRSHRGILSEKATLDIAPADVTYGRFDLVLVRVTYGNPSTMVLAVKTGTPSAPPVIAPTWTQVAGDVWEMPLALVYVDANATTIAAADVESGRFRYVYNPSNNPSDLSIVTFPNNTGSFWIRNNHEYRIDGTMIVLGLWLRIPDEQVKHYHSTVVFTSPNSSSWQGVHFYYGSGNTEYTAIKKYGASMTQQNKRYHLDIFWDGEYYWCNAMAA